jgi:hypothetical protein
MNLSISTRRLFLYIMFISLFVMATRSVLDADFWWHLRTGQWIMENKAIPHDDPFSFTFSGKIWTAHEWLSEILLFSVYQSGGLRSLALIFSGIITVAYGLAFLRSPGKPYVAGFATILGAIASAPIWGVRPQIFTLLLFSIYLILLDKYFATGRPSFILPLPILMILWVNLHAGYAVGLFLILIYVATKWLESFLPEIWSADNECLPSRDLILPALGVFVSCLIAVMLNPNGASMYRYPFDTLDSKAMMTLIAEWFSPNFHSREWLPLALFIILLLASGLFSRKRSSITEITLIATLGFAAFRSMRNVPLFAIVAIPVLAQHVSGIIPIRIGIATPSKWIKSTNVIILAFIVFAGIAQVNSILLNQKADERKYFPVAAVDWIKENKPSGNIFNTYGWGGFLIWHLFPDYPVFIDGRADIYGDDFMNEYLKLYNAEPDWESHLQKAGVNMVLVETSSPIADALARDDGWSIANTDKISVLYIRK